MVRLFKEKQVLEFSVRDYIIKSVILFQIICYITFLHLALFTKSFPFCLFSLLYILIGFYCRDTYAGFDVYDAPDISDENRLVGIEVTEAVTKEEAQAVIVISLNTSYLNTV